MILPYSTDAPIYYFPWMTIVLIVVNCCTFALTGMGLYSDGWLLQYGNGLHPVEWLAYNFLHFGPVHLLGNMFFLWAFGIVVEGKLGWWKFLAIYLGVGIVGGLVIQVAMLGYQIRLDDFAAVSDPPPGAAWWEPASALAQEAGIDDPLMGDDEAMLADDDGEAMADDELTPEEIEQIREFQLATLRPGAGGASLVVFALLGIVLVWAPKNEVTCFFLIGVRAGTFELEYLYFCGLKIVSEVIGTVFGVRGFEVTSEVAHLLGAFLGFGAGALFLKQNWVDCENWDLFAYLQNKHGSMVQVGAWQEAALVSHRKDRKIPTAAIDGLDASESRSSAPRKRRAKSKLKALESFDDDATADEPPEESVAIVDDFDVVEESEPTKPPSRVSRPAANSPGQSLRAAIKDGQFDLALAEVRRQRAEDRWFALPKAELAALADGFFKAQNVRDTRPLLEEFIKRFPTEADRQRVKLAVLYVKFLKSPAAALKMLATVDKASLPTDYQQIHQRAARQAQQMIADGVTDAI